MSATGDRKLCIGVAGLGRAFAVMLPTFTADPRVKLVAAADTRAEARQRFAEEFSASGYATVDELCADPAVDVIYVATPHQYHAQHALLAAQHGKHLLVEKPMALTLEECTHDHRCRSQLRTCILSLVTAIHLMRRSVTCEI